jgi:hypothetical protein
MRIVILTLTVAAMAAAFLFMGVYQGTTRAEAVLRERAGLTDEQSLDLSKAGPFLEEDGSSEWGTTLWCGFVDGDVTRPVASLEGRLRRGHRDFRGSALGWAPRSDRERRMLAQCAERLRPPALP